MGVCVCVWVGGGTSGGTLGRTPGGDHPG